MTERMAYVNGRVVPESQATVSVYDRGFMSGYGVFERTRTFRGELFRLDQHVARLYRSLRAVRIDPGLSPEAMGRATVELTEQNRATLGPNDDFFVGHYVTKGPDRGGPTVVILCEPIDFKKFAPHYLTGGHAVTTSVRAVPSQVWDPKIKATSRIHLLLAENEARQVDPEAYPLLMTLEGNITELTSANFWIVKAGTLVTAPVQDILEGVTRGAVLELAEHLGIPVQQVSYQLYDVMNADEAFLTTTSRCVLPLTRVNGSPIGDGKPGPIVGRLQNGWAELYGADFVSQALSHLDSVAVVASAADRTASLA